MGLELMVLPSRDLHADIEDSVVVGVVTLLIHDTHDPLWDVTWQMKGKWARG